MANQEKQGEAARTGKPRAEPQQRGREAKDNERSKPPREPCEEPDIGGVIRPPSDS